MAGSLAESVELLVVNPPQIQSSTLDWIQAPLDRGSVTADALESIRRVRNNLFHGGKHPPHSPPGRDAALVEASLQVLHAVLEQHDELRNHYETVEF